MQENSEIINFDSTMRLMSSKNFFVENLASKEKIIFNETPEHKTQKLKQKKPAKMNSHADLVKESINFNKNLLILKKSLNYISKFEDSDADEDAILITTPTANFTGRTGKLKSTSNFNSKIERELSILETFDRGKREQTTRKVKSGTQFERKETFSIKSAKKGISVYKFSETGTSPRLLRNAVSVDEKRKMRKREQSNSLDEKLKGKVETEKSGEMEKNETCRNKINKQKRVEKRSKKKKKLTRRYSVFDKLSTRKYRKLALQKHLKRKEDEEMKECTFQPTINRVSKMICSFKELGTGKRLRGKINSRTTAFGI